MSKLYVIYGLLVLILFVYAVNRGASVWNVGGTAFKTTRSGPNHK